MCKRRSFEWLWEGDEMGGFVDVCLLVSFTDVPQNEEVYISKSTKFKPHQTCQTVSVEQPSLPWEGHVVWEMSVLSLYGRVEQTCH